jgi:hypothetical protein
MTGTELSVCSTKHPDDRLPQDSQHTLFKVANHYRDLMTSTAKAVFTTLWTIGFPAMGKVTLARDDFIRCLFGG